MTVQEIKKILEKFPDEETIEILYPEDSYGVQDGVRIDEIAYITGTKSVKSGVYIKLE